MNTLENTDGNGLDLQNGMQHDVSEVGKEARLLEENVRQAEREFLDRFGEGDIPRDLANLYAVLTAAGALAKAARKGHAAAPAGSETHVQLRAVADGAVKTVHQLNTFIERYILIGSGDAPREKEPKSSK